MHWPSLIPRPHFSHPPEVKSSLGTRLASYPGWTITPQDATITNKTVRNKLRTYRKFTPNFKLEPYLFQIKELLVGRSLSCFETQYISWCLFSWLIKISLFRPPLPPSELSHRFEFHCCKTVVHPLTPEFSHINWHSFKQKQILQ